MAGPLRVEVSPLDRSSNAPTQVSLGKTCDGAQLVPRLIELIQVGLMLRFEQLEAVLQPRRVVVEVLSHLGNRTMSRTSDLVSAAPRAYGVSVADSRSSSFSTRASSFLTRRFASVATLTA